MNSEASTQPGIIKLDIGCFDTRNNLPNNSRRTNTESDFLKAFETAYLRKVRKHGITANEFGFSIYGRADFIWIAWKPDPHCGDFSALGLEKRLKRHKLVAFEAKIRDWKKGFQQAFRYKYFADQSILVMPNNLLQPAISHIEIFRTNNIGLWGFEAESGKIHEHHTPSRNKPFCEEAKGLAIKKISINLNSFNTINNPS